MKKTILAFAVLSISSMAVSAQKYFTKDGSIRFYSTTKVEDIEATNNKATCVLDAATGDLEWSVLVKGFKFEKALMEEHFNENYMESDTHPKAGFKGKIENMGSIKLSNDGVYPVKVTGDLTMHGVTKKITTDATITVAGGKISTSSKFYVNPKDYNITIPAPVQGKISDKIEVTVSGALQELAKK